METHESRIERLERAYRRASTAALVLGAFVTLSVLTGQATPEPTMIGNPRGAHIVLMPTGITVYDRSGKSRIVLAIDSDGRPELNLRSEKGTNLVALDVETSGGIIRTRDASGQLRAYLGTYQEERSGLLIWDTRGTIAAELNSSTYGGHARFYDGKGTMRSKVGLFASGSAGLIGYDAAGKERMDVGVGPRGIPDLAARAADGTVVLDINGGTNGGFVDIKDGSGTRRAVLGMFATGNSGMVAFGSNGKEHVEALAAQSGGALRLSNPSGIRRAFLGVYGNGSSGTAVYDNAGQTIWSAP